jgi:hypothetical protein
MNSSQIGGKSKSSSKTSKTSKSLKSKKGGNFLGSVSELFVPTGWESFATAAGLLAIDRADAAFRRSKKTSKKQKGGTDIDGHESIEHMDSMLDEIHSEDMMSSPDQMSGGGPKKKAKKTTSKKPSTKTASKKPSKKTTTKKPSKKTSSKK